MQVLQMAFVRLGGGGGDLKSVECRTTFKLLVLIILSTLVAAEEELGQKIHSDLNDKSSSGQRPISETSSRTLTRTKRSLSSSEELERKANESQEQAAQIIEFRSSDNQIPAASPNFEAAFQGECSKERHRPSLCDHICLDLYDGTFECACRSGFALAVDGYSCTRHHRGPDGSVAATTSSPNETQTTTTDSPPYELITQENDSRHLQRATKWTTRASPIAAEPPGILISNSSSSLPAQTYRATLAGSARHAIRKLASEPERQASEAQGQVGRGGYSAENRRHQSGQNLPLGGNGSGDELKFQDDRATAADNKRARQAREWRDGGGGNGRRRARASAAERAQWKLSSRRQQQQRERQDSKPFEGDDDDDASQRDEMEGEIFDEERQEVAQANNDQRGHSSAASYQHRKADDLQGNWISPAPIWTRRAARDQDNSLERQLASASATGKALRPAVAADGSSKLELEPVELGEDDGGSELEDADEDERPPPPRSWSSFDRLDVGVQDSLAQQGLGLGPGEDYEEEEREHRALERELGLLENLIGKTMADYRHRPRWPPKLG